MLRTTLHRDRTFHKAVSNIRGQNPPNENIMERAIKIYEIFDSPAQTYLDDFFHHIINWSTESLQFSLAGRSKIHRKQFIVMVSDVNDYHDAHYLSIHFQHLGYKTTANLTLPQQFDELKVMRKTILAWIKGIAKAFPDNYLDKQRLQKFRE